MHHPSIHTHIYRALSVLKPHSDHLPECPFSPDLQEGFAPPEDDDLEEQAHLGQDEYWSPRFPSLPPENSIFSFLFLFDLISFLLCTLYKYSLLSLTCPPSVSSFSFWYVYLFPTPPLLSFHPLAIDTLHTVTLQHRSPLLSSTAAMSNISQLEQHEQLRINSGMEVCYGKRWILSL